ncbi:DUF3105 domain-containing protein [Actinotalea sp. AC32]|nr:DUF3105 domain-containing protein [Actinotalea sp. AC32]
MSKQQQNRDREARLAALRADQERADRKRRLVVWGATGAVVVGLVGAAAVPIVNQARQNAELEAAASAPIEGVEVFEGLPANHVEGPVEYETAPPAGGDHSAAWLNCGVYDEPVPLENAVHSLEHGAVWIAYDPSLPADDVASLTERATGEAYALVSPYEDLDAPVVLTAWGHQLELDSADDPRVDVFLERYLQGEQTPEPGAACFGGVGTPVA